MPKTHSDSNRDDQSTILPTTSGWPQSYFSRAGALHILSSPRPERGRRTFWTFAVELMVRERRQGGPPVVPAPKGVPMEKLVVVASEPAADHNPSPD